MDCQPIEVRARRKLNVALPSRRGLFEVLGAVGVELIFASYTAPAMAADFGVLKSRVHNRGRPPDSFLEELVAWARSAPGELFAPNAEPDVYASVKPSLGPWRDDRHRRAVMLEVMRVLAGFESSWNWNAGVDTTNPTSTTPETIEAGAWQISANSRSFGDDLKVLVRAKVGSFDGNDFQRHMKADHLFAMEYTSRLLRHTVRHHGPVKRHEIDPWLRRDAVATFERLI